MATILPAGRKMAQNSVDMTLGLCISLVWREGAERGAPIGSAGGKDECPDRREKHRTNHPTPGKVPGSWRKGKWAFGASPEKKDVIQ